jgi:hypothetical protein
MHSLQFENIVFITLTYGAQYPTDPKIYKAHIKEYRRRFERAYGKIPAIWRLEFQQRGAPHYHILYLDPPHIPVQDWNAVWTGVVGKQYPGVGKNALDLKATYDKSQQKQIGYYLSKYAGKPDERKRSEVTTWPGRWWGRWNIDEPVPITIQLDPVEAWLFTSALLSDRKDGQYVPADTYAFSLFGENLGTDNFQRYILALCAAQKAEKRVPKMRTVTITT